MKNGAMKPALMVAFISLLWGSEWVFDANLVDLPHFQVLALRCLIAAVVLTPWLRGNRPVPIRFSALLGVVVIVLPASLLAMRADISAGMVVLLFATMPMIASIAEEGSGLSHATALLGGLAGTAFLVRGGLSLSLSQVVPVLLLLLVLIGISLALVRAKQALFAVNIPASVAIQMFTAAIVYGLLSLFSERGSSARWTSSAIASVLILGMVCNGLAYICFYGLIRQIRVSQAATVQWLIPIVSVAGTALWLRHLPAWDSVLGGASALICVIALLRSPGISDAPLTLEITTLRQDGKPSLRSDAD